MEFSFNPSIGSLYSLPEIHGIFKQLEDMVAPAGGEIEKRRAAASPDLLGGLDDAGVVTPRFSLVALHAESGDGKCLRDLYFHFSQKRIELHALIRSDEQGGRRFRARQQPQQGVLDSRIFGIRQIENELGAQVDAVLPVHVAERPEPLAVAVEQLIQQTDIRDAAVSETDHIVDQLRNGFIIPGRHVIDLAAGRGVGQQNKRNAGLPQPEAERVVRRLVADQEPASELLA